jgi:hypothetical protein
LVQGKVPSAMASALATPIGIPNADAHSGADADANTFV